jgi:ketosteroid isomerase-like protein
VRLDLRLLPLVLALAAPLSAEPPASPVRAIRDVIAKQAADWNRGDIDAFASGYKNSPDILFIGRTLHRGYAEMLATYRKSYPTRERMGMLSFSQVEVQPLDARFATVTGHFHLERAPASGGNDDGYYLLVFEKTPIGWKIVRDDSTGLPKDSAR